MTATVKNKIGLTVPPAVQHQAGFKPGDVVEFKVSGGVITILPKLPAADEYTPEQRRIIDARLKAAEKTPLHGPFKDGKEIAAYLKSFTAQRSTRPSKPLKSR